jgi:cardiolipin synthase
VLIDAIGGRLIDSSLIDHMADCGVQVEWFRKPLRTSLLKQDHRTHRKVLICDEQVGFTGGVGIAEEWCGDARDETEWRDTHVRVEGPAVDGLSASFAQNWARPAPAHRRRAALPRPRSARTGASVVQVAAAAPASAGTTWPPSSASCSSPRRTGSAMMTGLLRADDCFQQLMLDAVAAGVQVDVMLPGPHADKRVCQLASESIYSSLVRAACASGRSSPSMLHAKVLTIDGIASVIGSANMNRRRCSSTRGRPLSVLDPAVATRLEDDFDRELARCDRIEPRRWEDRPLHQKAQEKATTVIHRFL